MPSKDDWLILVQAIQLTTVVTLALTGMWHALLPHETFLFLHLGSAVLLTVAFLAYVMLKWDD